MDDPQPGSGNGDQSTDISVNTDEPTTSTTQHD